MVVVQALQSFEHNGPRKREAIFHVSEPVAIRLSEAGLVKIVSHGAEVAPAKNPPSAAGNPSSASPAAQASQRKTSSEYVGGAKKRRRKSLEASSL